MIIGLVTLFIALFAGNVDIFYVDKIEEGVKKEVKDKDRKQEIQALLDDHGKALKQFNKEREKHIDELKEKSMDRGTEKKWFAEFFKMRIEERDKIQEQVIDKRIELQQLIKSDEWERIMDKAAVEATKLERKEMKKEMKDRDKNFFKSQEEIVKSEITDESRRKEVLAALEKYEMNYENISNSLEDIDVNQTDFLDDQNATKADMMSIIRAIDKQRLSLYTSYTDLYFSIRENTTEEEWEPIIKQILKTIK